MPFFEFRGGFEVLHPFYEHTIMHEETHNKELKIKAWLKF